MLGLRALLSHGRLFFPPWQWVLVVSGIEFVYGAPPAIAEGIEAADSVPMLLQRKD
jgi:hypothetical protein